MCPARSQRSYCCPKQRITRKHSWSEKIEFGLLSFNTSEANPSNRREFLFQLPVNPSGWRSLSRAALPYIEELRR